MDRFDYQTRPFRGARGRSVAALALALFGLVVGREALAFAEDIVAPGTLLLDVDTVVDSTDANPADGVCADSQGRCSLRAAVQEFNAFGPDEGLIRVPGGTYALELVGAGELFSATGDLNVTGGVLRIDGSGDPANPTIIQGTASWDDRLISVAGTSDLTIENMVLSGGNVGGNGGAVWAADTSSLTLRDCSVTGNTAAGNGGGVAAQGTGLTVERCRIGTNVAGSSGGGLYTEATTAVIRDTTIDGNGAGTAGGGLWAYSELGSVAVVNSTVSGNQATNGGGILSAGNVGLYSVTVTANLAESVYPDDTPHGGGLYASGFTELRNSIVAGNAAGDAATLYSEDCYGDINDLRSRGYNLLGSDNPDTHRKNTKEKAGRAVAVYSTSPVVEGRHRLICRDRIGFWLSRPNLARAKFAGLAIRSGGT
ncbi:right-handed parallel beta-helix repeat-containing protein [Thiohalomonas denitrificans]|uniref:right-handed parallel beta-helix repeat-containing protein n=1 Tax=Thiohalomonas denitrificans TaxID=415747 RepID=UPI0026ED9276|nr:right-handed parallel beta-helix repeat-containing protein [Thiohalomonas denitrificans]